jgi:RNA 2',3'-cyclic 3'-phosphodiesterase
MIRTFLALELPEALKGRLSALDAEFVQHASVLKWSAPNLIHITLRFLGGVPEGRMPLVMEAALEAAARVRPFTLALSGLGAFPAEGKPRVIWVGLASGEAYDALQDLFTGVEAGLAARDFPAETRAFSPHITLARTRDTISEAERRALGTRLAEVAGRTDIEGHVPVRALTVMRSDLSRTGPTYTAMARYSLGGVAEGSGSKPMGRAE